MKEIPRAKRLEVALLYLLGDTFLEIEEETGVSHGSVANIIRELEEGELVIPGTPLDQLNDLRKLSFDLKKNGLKPSQALLGISFFKRLDELQITPQDFESWSELIKRLKPDDFSADEFLQVALRLHELEQSYDISFETITEEYKSTYHKVEELKQEINSLGDKKSKLATEIKILDSKLDSLKKEKGRIENDIYIQTDRLKEFRTQSIEVYKEKESLSKEIRSLRQSKVRLSAEVDGKKETLRRLSVIGFLDEDLLRLKSFLERMAKSRDNDISIVKEDFFTALVEYQDIEGLKQRREAEAKGVRELEKEKSTLYGEIKEIEKRKGMLQGEIDSHITSVCEHITTFTQEACTALNEQVTHIQNEFEKVMEDAVGTGVAIGEMRQMINKGEDTEKSLMQFITETKQRLGVE